MQNTQLSTESFASTNQYLLWVFFEKKFQILTLEFILESQHLLAQNEQ